jgi:hypothetical protein
VLPSSFEASAAGGYRKGRGCEACHRIGTFGRIGVFELLEVDEEFQSLIARRAPASELRDYAVQHGYRTLEEDAFLKAGRGLMPPDDLLTLGGPIAVAYDELCRATAEAPESADQEDTTVHAEPESPDLVSWEEVAELANLLDD